MSELVYVTSSRPRKRKGVTARARAAKRRKEGPVVKSVRAECVKRDDYCRFMGISPCEGPSEWCHMEEKQRFRTRGMAPEVRHTTTHSFMGCSRHHRLYDAGELRIFASQEYGANRPMLIRDADGGEWHV